MVKELIKGLIVFTIETIPRGKGRPKFRRAGKHIQTYTDEKTRAAEEEFRTLSESYRPPAPLTGPLSIIVVAFMPAPKYVLEDMRKKKTSTFPPCAVRPDGDNILKLVLDSMQGDGGFFHDDAQIVAMRIEKQYGLVPGYYVSLEELCTP